MGRTFAFSDLHGEYDLWRQIKDFLQPNDVAYFLGDAIDRGKDGFKIMKEMLEDKRIIYIRGNHEDMMMKALEQIKHYRGEWFGECLDLWSANGCYPTIEAWEEDGSDYKWINIINEMPLIRVHINEKGQELYLCHAGFTPGKEISDVLWDRDHFLDEIPEEYYDLNFIVIHGHTPIPYLLFELMKDDYYFDNSENISEVLRKQIGICIYANGCKIDIDGGTVNTHVISLLDLDTFEVIKFKEGE